MARKRPNCDLPEKEFVESIKSVYEIRRESQNAQCQRCLPVEVFIKMSLNNTKGLHVHANTRHNIWQKKPAQPLESSRGFI
jgi:hypothetical protein